MSSSILIQKDFEKVIKNWFRNFAQRAEYLSLNQIAHIAFGKGDAYYTKRTNDVIKSRSAYFQRDPSIQGRHSKYCVDWKQVETDYSELVWGPSPPEEGEDPPDISQKLGMDDMTIEEQIQRALADEIRDSGRLQVGKSVEVVLQGPPDPVQESWLYQARVVKVHSDEFAIEEGAPILLQWNHDSTTIQADLLKVDNESGMIAFATKKALPISLVGQHAYIRLSTQHLIQSLSGRVESVLMKPSSIVKKLLHKALIANTVPDPIEVSGFLSLDEVQRRALDHGLQRDLTLLWGPPGTGKTYVLAHIIALMALAGKKVLVTSISNIAVDQVALKVIQVLQAMDEGQFLKNGKLLRFGRAKLPAVIATDALFPGKQEIDELREELRNLIDQLPGLENNFKAYSVAQLRIINLRNKIKEASKARLDFSSVIFTTTAQVAASQEFVLGGFDSVVIDEASMMPIPTVLAMAGFANRSIIVAGDPKQLGPITVSSSPAALKWLHEDVFSKLEVENRVESSACVMLQIQRRMDPEICEVINPFFYDGQLINQPIDLQSIRTPRDFFPIINVIPTKGPVEFTKGGSRRNEWTANLLMKFLASYARKNPTLHIGVIAPYRAQVALLKELVKEHPKLRLQQERRLLLISTIHTFQGSEQDIIFYDMVDTAKTGAGQLYEGETGSRLVNVAISRAKSHLVIVGDLELLLDQRISMPLHMMRKSLRAYEVDWHSRNTEDFQSLQN